MLYKTLRQQGKELLAAKRYDELQALLSVEREKLAVEMYQTLPYVPGYLPRFLVGIYAKLLVAGLKVLAINHPAVLPEEARLANQTRRIETIIELERQLLAALNREAKTLVEEARLLERESGVIYKSTSW
jgi:hypothetical protein